MDLKFVSAQPDVGYFHWQSEIYIKNFLDKGIRPENIHVLFGMWNTKVPSEEGKKIKNYGVNVHFYEDQRTQKFYHPSIKPYLISKWLEEFPNYGKIFFLHDADIIFRELPDYSKYLSDDTCYLGDTISYIGYNYLKDCCLRYEKKYPESEKLELLKKMTDVVGISISKLIDNQNNSGGGQYIIKNTKSEDWFKIYEDSNKIYNTMKEYHKKFPLNQGEIQFWTAEMWSLLWNLWKLEKKTKIVDDLDFTNATEKIENYYKKPILHMAGILDSMKSTKFYKGQFINDNPIKLMEENLNYFDYVDSNSVTIKYIEVIKSLVQKS